MSLKDLFKEQNYKHLDNSSVSSLTSSGVESAEYISEYVKDRDRFIPLVDYSKPEDFARFGSAEKYYYDSIVRTYSTYPYDGSRKEKISWELSSSGLDLHIFNNDYPRTTGYVVFSTASLTATDTSTDYSIWGSYGAAGTGTYEYISFQGGPHPGEGTNVYIDPDTGEAHYRKDANLYDLSKNRECNLKIGGNDGNTVEFWLKKAAFDVDATQTEVVFDIFTTSSISSSLDYGRLKIELSGHGAGTNTLSPFYVTYMSGTDGISKENIGASLTTSSVADDSWHHYSFRFKNDGSNTSVDLFVDGEHNDNITTGTSVDYVSGTIVGTIGALATHPSGTTSGAPQAAKGWGKLSGSLDEFRFWKVWRTSKQIQTRWFDQVGGGTNTDDANTHLGLYYKFNEGITGQTSTDVNVLDYSGRVSNGSWTGYSSAYSRNTGSAINDSGISTYFATEFEDPIIYANHPEVISVLKDKRNLGKEHDYENPSTIYYSLPSWIIEEHDANNPDNEGIIANSLWNLTQIISSQFDNMAMLMKSVPDLSQNSYVSGTQKPIPFMNRILESKGFVAPEIFNALDALEYFENRDRNSTYEEKVSNVKNIIFKNIYNNLTYIYKSKGTEKSFRNLIRCFGVNDKIYKLNYYSNNVDYVLEDNFYTVSENFKFINFNTINNADASVYQYSSSLNPNSTTFISASNDFDFLESPEYSLPFSVEAAVVFPNRVSQADYSTFKHSYSDFQNKYPLVMTSSLFGMHTAIGNTPEDTTWNSNDYANFTVSSIKGSTFSNKAKFLLTGTAGGFIPELTSSFYDDVYKDSQWNFLVSLYSEKYENTNQVDGTENSDYIVQFSGIQKVLDETINQFTVTGTISAEEAVKFLASSKRTFIGSHRENFTGSVLQRSDVKFNNFRVWQNKLDINDLGVHASDPLNYSIKNPVQNAYLFNESNNRVYVPNKETLLLHWNFDNVTGSDASGEFIVEDLTSGSSEQITRYGILGDLSSKQYTGKGFEFDTNSTSVAIFDDLVVAKPNIPEVISNENTVKVLQNDDIYFKIDSRPTFFDLNVEKSPYQDISAEMLKFISTVVDFNDLIGHPVHRYRGEYKSLNILKQMFFERMDTPDIEKYIEYFKWFDAAITDMILQLAPLSSGLPKKPLRNVIESHILERVKYQSKFPTYEFKQSDPEASIFGINEMLYPWKEGHAPLSEEESDNCHWFKDRAERDGIPTSGDSDVDSDRQEIIDVINNQSNTTPPNLSGSSGTYQGSTYALRRFPRPYKIGVNKEPQIHGGGNVYENKKVGFWDSLRKRPTPAGADEGGALIIEPPDTDLDMFKDCDDNLELNKGKRKYNFSVGVAQDGIDEFTGVFKGDLVFPFSIYSSSVDSNPAMADLEDFQSNLAITNLHHDSYGPFSDVPMQGPFTEKFVGGRAYRHVMTNFTWDNEEPDSEGERLEGWRLTASSDTIDLVNPSAPRSVYFREEYAKRPVNIKNIKQLTSSLYDADDQATDAYGVTRIGNYTNTYEIVMTNGRSINNRYLAESDGDLAATTSDSVYVSGVVDFPLPRRDLTGSSKAIIVNRFSAPGDAATMGEGMLDIAAGEYSVYNALPFRNLSVRMPLDELYSDHANQFGFFSDARTVADYERADWADYPGGSSSIDDPDADLDYRGTGSFHKVNRNGRKQPKYSNEYTGDLGTVEIDTAYDNWFVQHQIPQTDVQYAWITASLIENYTGSTLYGFEQPDFSNASLASTDLIFASASDSGSGDLKVDFAGINTLVLDGVLSASNLLSSSDYFNDDIGSLDDALTVNAILSHRGGPAGGANWKLYKKDNHPIVRAHRAENRLSFLKPVFGTDSNGKQLLLSGSKGSIQSVIEPPITSKYKQLKHVLVVKQGAAEEEITINHSYMNNIRYFTDHSTDIAANRPDLDDILLKPNKNIKKEQQTLDIINYYLYQASDFNEAEEYNPISELVSYTTRETIFPKEQYTYLSSHRQREDYENDFWRDDIDDRRDRASGKSLNAPGPGYRSIEATHPYNFVYTGNNNFFFGRADTAGAAASFYKPGDITASIWSLDARTDYEVALPGRIPSSTLEISFERRPGLFEVDILSGTDGSGILQNSLMPYSQFVYMTGAFGSIDIPELRPISGFAFPQYNRRIAGAIDSDSDSEYKFGDTKWEAGEQSGKAPFYDTYDDYIEEIKRVGKDCSLIPEFRISNHMDYYLNEAEDGFLSQPDNLLEITGAAIPDSSDSSFAEIYSNTDFLKTFSIVNDFYGTKTKSSRITLSAEALIKFLPYDGFYPSERTVELAGMFYESYSASFSISGNISFGQSGFEPVEVEIGDIIEPEYTYALNPVWKSLFAPGILFNSIKSGIGVDYPVHTSDVSLEITGTANSRNSLGHLVNIPRISSSFDFRVPFEALLDPEGEIGGVEIIDNEPHPSASLDLTSSLASPGTLNYKLAMNNFLASTIDFFKPNGDLTTIVSFADNDDKFNNVLDPTTNQIGFQKGKEYRMRLAMYNGVVNTEKLWLEKFNVFPGFYSASFAANPQSCIMYAQTGSNVSIQKQADYYGSSFGPPVHINETSGLVLSTNVDGYPLYGSASYSPYTPPYYDGLAYIEFIFRPENSSDYANIGTILENLTQTYERKTTSAHPDLANYNEANEKGKMTLSSSINISVLEQATVELDEDGNPISFVKGSTGGGNVLTIQPKWETPILNFKDVDVTLPDVGSGSVARGMWHQYGVRPNNSEGIFLQVQDLSRAEIIDLGGDPALTGSLALQLGLRKDPFKLGRVAEKKKISEAIVAIPFFTDKNGNIKKFKIDSGAVDVAIKIASKKQSGLQQTQNTLQPDLAIIDMVSKMKKFVIPPHLDFVTRDDIDPFAMFIFDFEVELTEKDLTDIWQNLSPSIGTQFKKTQASLPIDLFFPEKLPVTANGVEATRHAMLKYLPENTRWQVFKVKQRSAINYFEKTANSADDDNFQFNFNYGGQGSQLSSVPKYSYNWPYDFFSLIELAKLDAEIENTVNIPSGDSFDADLLETIMGVIANDINVPEEEPPTLDFLDLDPAQQLLEAAAPGGPATPAPSSDPLQEILQRSAQSNMTITNPVVGVNTAQRITPAAMSPRFQATPAQISTIANLLLGSNNGGAQISTIANLLLSSNNVGNNNNNRGS